MTLGQRKMKSDAFPVDPVGCDLSLWRWKLENPDGKPRSSPEPLHPGFCS